jgi:hypothetical protein
MSGLPEVDVEDLRANTEYQGYTPSSPQIQWFWRAVRLVGYSRIGLISSPRSFMCLSSPSSLLAILNFCLSCSFHYDY